MGCHADLICSCRPSLGGSQHLQFWWHRVLWERPQLILVSLQGTLWQHAAIDCY
jgi:hypothetical protein